jgi:hypothetical protein
MFGFLTYYFLWYPDEWSSIGPESFTWFVVVLWIIMVVFRAVCATILFMGLAVFLGGGFELSFRRFGTREQSSEESEGLEELPNGQSNDQPLPNFGASMRHDPSTDLAFLNSFFLLVALALAGAYYHRRYDSRGTVKPDWWDAFG